MPRKLPRPKPLLTIDELTGRKYSSPEVAQRIAKLARDAGTHEAIEDGRLVLPSEPDAIAYLALLDEEREGREVHE